MTKMHLHYGQVGDCIEYCQKMICYDYLKLKSFIRMLIQFLKYRLLIYSWKVGDWICCTSLFCEHGIAWNAKLYWLVTCR